MVFKLHFVLLYSSSKTQMTTYRALQLTKGHFPRFQLSDTLFKAIFHQAEVSARSDYFFCLKTNWRESGHQKTKENIIPRGKFRLAENDP